MVRQARQSCLTQIFRYVNPISTNGGRLRPPTDYTPEWYKAGKADALPKFSDTLTISQSGGGGQIMLTIGFDSPIFFVIMPLLMTLLIKKLTGCNQAVVRSPSGSCQAVNCQ